MSLRVSTTVPGTHGKRKVFPSVRVGGNPSSYAPPSRVTEASDTFDSATIFSGDFSFSQMTAATPSRKGDRDLLYSAFTQLDRTRYKIVRFM